MLSSGLLIADRYRLTSRVAVGGMGEVWEASDTRLDRRVAVKILKAELSGDAEFLHRFRTEARTTASLNHPGIAGVHDYGETVAGEHSIAFLVMEFVEGEPLAAILAREGRLAAERTMDILEQAGHALQAAHEGGLVHRDIKPGNILVTSSGTVKVTDFGIAKASNAAPVTRSGMVMGTAHYIAPEQALGHDASPVSDVYSLAVCGYECLAGRRPFLSDHAVSVAMMHIRDLPPPLPPDVPPGPRALIEVTLVKDPAQRYATGGEFANAVASVRAGRPLPAPSGMAVAGYQLSQGSPAVVGGPPPVPAPTPGTGSHPSMQPVPAPGAPPPQPGPVMTPVARQRRAPAALWILAVVLTVVLVVAVVLVVVLGNDDGNGSTGGTPEPPARVGDDWPSGNERSLDGDGIRGMIGTAGRVIQRPVAVSLREPPAPEEGHPELAEGGSRTPDQARAEREAMLQQVNNPTLDRTL